MEINNQNLTILLPIYNCSKILDVFLSSFYYYVPNPPKIMVMDNASTDNPRALVDEYKKQYNIEYVDCGTGNTDPYVRGSDTVVYFINNCAHTEYWAFMHSDVEITDFGFWDAVNTHNDCDIIYTGRWYPYKPAPVGNHTYVMLAGVNNFFIVLKKDMVDEYMRQGGVFHAAHEHFTLSDGKTMSLTREIFVDLYDWASDNYKNIHQIDIRNIFIHYCGLTRLSQYEPHNVKPDIREIMEYIDTKIEFKNTFGLPYHPHFAKRLEQLFRKRINW